MRKVITLAPKIKAAQLKDSILTSPAIQKAAYLNNIGLEESEAENEYQIGSWGLRLIEREISYLLSYF